MGETVDISVQQSFMNICNITFKVPRLNTFFFKKCLEKIYLHD